MIQLETRIDVYETLCTQQMLVHKGGGFGSVGVGGSGWGVRVDVNKD